MVIGIIAENCSGKSTLANEIQRTIGSEIRYIAENDMFKVRVLIG